MPEFRAAYFAQDYEATLAFYRDGLELPVIESWDRGRDDRGTIFRAAEGRIEILALPEEREEGSAWDYRRPAGVFLVIEVEDVSAAYERARARGLSIREDLKLQPWGHRSFVVADPEGFGIYLYTDEKEETAR